MTERNTKVLPIWVIDKQNQATKGTAGHGRQAAERQRQDAPGMWELVAGAEGPPQGETACGGGGGGGRANLTNSQQPGHGPYCL